MRQFERLLRDEKMADLRRRRKTVGQIAAKLGLSARHVKRRLAEIKRSRASAA